MIRCVELCKEYKTVAEAAKDTGIDSKNINKVINGDRQTAGGYHWLHYDENALKTEQKKKRIVTEEEIRQVLDSLDWGRFA